MALDVLTNEASQEREIKGMKTGEEEVGLSSFVDDIIKYHQKTLKIIPQDFRPDKFTKVKEDKVQHT